MDTSLLDFFTVKSVLSSPQAEDSAAAASHAQHVRDSYFQTRRLRCFELFASDSNKVQSVSTQHATVPCRADIQRCDYNRNTMKPKPAIGHDLLIHGSDMVVAASL